MRLVAHVRAVMAQGLTWSHSMLIAGLIRRCVARRCRWEAHLWVKELGRQVYLGGYEAEEHAARPVTWPRSSERARACAPTSPSRDMGPAVKLLSTKVRCPACEPWGGRFCFSEAV